MPDDQLKMTPISSKLFTDKNNERTTTMRQLKSILNPWFPGDSQNTLLPKIKNLKGSKFCPSSDIILDSLYAYALCFLPKWKKGTLAEFNLDTNYLEMIYPSTTEVKLVFKLLFSQHDWRHTERWISQRRILPYDSTKARNSTLAIFFISGRQIVFQTANLPQMDNVTFPFIWDP